LLDLSIDGAKRVLYNITGSDDITMFEVEEASNVITESVDPNARIIFGTVIDEKADKGEIQITVIATGFKDESEDDDIVITEEPKKTEVVNTGFATTINKVSTSANSHGRSTTMPEEKEITITSGDVEKVISRGSDNTDTGLNQTENISDGSSTNPMEPTMIIKDPVEPTKPVQAPIDVSADNEDDSDITVPAFIRKKLKK
jgi:hypothetical protein